MRRVKGGGMAVSTGIVPAGTVPAGLGEPPPGSMAGVPVPAALAAGASLTGCTTAPSQVILGSYFPSWMICALGGLLVAVVAHRLLVAAGVDKALPVPPLVYLAITVAAAFGVWLIWLE